MAVRMEGLIERMERMGLGVVDPDVGLTTMTRRLGELAIPAYSRAAQRPLFLANIFLWDVVSKGPTPPILSEFAVAKVPQKAVGVPAKQKAEAVPAMSLEAVIEKIQGLVEDIVGSQVR
jgi:hypothetical protein